MKLSIYQIDAFANELFEGNPAAVVPLTKWLPDELMQKIAMENNLSETVFLVENEKGYHIRWFTPICEVNLCGHATLAGAYVIFEYLDYDKDTIEFTSKSGPLTVTRIGEYLDMDFPAQLPVACDIPVSIKQAFDCALIACSRGEDYLVVFENEQDLIDNKPDLKLLSQLDLRGVIITARSKHYDFVTRYFAPKCGINEDPVTGSAFTQLIPYWANELYKTELTARQVSQRGGEVRGRLFDQRVRIAGKAVTYLVGEIDTGIAV